MDITILIPVLNESRHIKTCLEALTQQRPPRGNVETIVIDNGSRDETLKIVEGFARVRLLHEPRPDPYLARNRGIEAAKGRIIAFTDGDCRADEGWLCALERAFDEGADIVVGRLAYPEGGSFWLDRYTDYYDAKTRWLFAQPEHPGIYGHGGNMAVRAELFEKLGDFPELPVAGDTEFLHRARQKIDDVSIRYVEDAVVTHLEVETYRSLLPKLSRYGVYSSAVHDASHYRVLTLSERVAVMFRCARDHHYGPVRILGLLITLGLGLVSFEWGRRGRSQREQD